MSTISNKFFVTAIEDGTTLHGALRASRTLVQMYNDSTGACSPDWQTDTSSQPIIYLSLINGTQYVSPDSDYTWFYNGSALIWTSSADNAVDESGLFQKVPNYIPTGYGVSVPAIKIIGNLASSNNVDIDVIRFNGKKTMSTSALNFSATIDIRISQWVSGGYLGTLSFLNGVADITETNRSVTVFGSLYNDLGEVTQNVDFVWYLNEDEISSTTTTDSAYIDSSGRLVVTEAAVVDYATVKCEFYHNNNKVWTEYVGIDDTQDPEFMYIQYNSQSGNAASLRVGMSVMFEIWIGTMANPQPDTTWQTFKVKLLDATGTPISGDLSTYSNTIALDDNDGYRVMNYDSVTTHKASITIPYSLANNYGKAITGIILATK